MNRLRGITVVLSLGMSFLTVASSQPRSPIQIVISTSSSTYDVGAPIRLQLTLANVSDKPVDIYTPSGKPNGGVAEDYNGIVLRESSGMRLQRIDWPLVRREDGTTVRMPPGLISLRGVPLAPGDHFEDFTILTRHFDLTKPGEYSITVLQDVRIDHAVPKPTHTTATSNTIRFTIVAPPTNQ